jgi:hypothetical protein
MATTPKPLSNRTLNRTLLQRQLLLERADLAAEDAVAHLVGLQSQTPASPYPGLWTRLDGFDFADLGRLLTERRAVRMTLMRGTLHLVTAQDALLLRPWVQPVLERAFRGSAYARGLAGATREEIVAFGTGLLREEPRTSAALRTAFAARFPEAEPTALAAALHFWCPLVQLPPRGVWGAGGEAVFGLLEDWLGRPLAAPDPAALVRRYLAAFGPASVADMQKWSGLTGLKEHVSGLRTYTAAEDGRLLHDLPDGELADPERPAPARYVADFDNLVLGHADRSRVVPEAFRGRVMTVNGIVRGTVLVDGFVAGTWRFVRGRSRASVAVTPFAPLPAQARTALTAEGLRLLSASDPGVAHEVTFPQP